MITETFEAWVLHKSPSGDTSARVSFFTREKGIVNCLYKGGRTPKKQAILQPFLPLWLAIDIRKECHLVRQLEMQKDTLTLRGESVFAGLYVNELVFYALRPMDSYSELFEAYRNTIIGLAALHDKLSIEILLRRFEWSLLLACGYSISLTHEARSAVPIVVNQYYQFIPSEGFLLAASGFPGEDILAMAQGRLDELQVLKTAKWVMRRAISHLLGGRELKSRLLYPRNLFKVGVNSHPDPSI